MKAGGGGNAREIRLRKTKKKGRRDEDSDEESGTLMQGTACYLWVLTKFSQGFQYVNMTIILSSSYYNWTAPQKFSGMYMPSSELTSQSMCTCSTTSGAKTSMKAGHIRKQQGITFTFAAP